MNLLNSVQDKLIELLKTNKIFLVYKIRTLTKKLKQKQYNNLD